jgi:FdhD protein
MTEPPPGAIEKVQARRIATAPGGGPGIEEEVGVAREGQLCIDVERVETYTILCTPHDREALAAGFLLSEGLIESMDDVAHLAPCETAESVMRVRLHRQVPGIGDPGRNLLIVSSCGLCGSEELEKKVQSLPAVGSTLEVPGSVLRVAGQALRQVQPCFEACGGTHAAGIFDASGTLLSVAEDTGRHNALDKAIGRCLLEGVPTAGRGVILSGRVSLEMVGKCARAGIELMAAVSATTSLAIEVAEHCNITLCAFVRETRATIFTHPWRVLQEPWARMRPGRGVQ